MMKAKSEIDAGICGFHTAVRVHSEDDQNVTFAVDSNCEKIQRLGARLAELGALDAYEEINPSSESVLMTTVRAVLPGCCAGCAVPVGLFKAMQVAAGLALPKDIHIAITQE